MTNVDRIDLAHKLTRLGVKFEMYEHSGINSWHFHEDGISFYTGDGGAQEVADAVEAGVDELSTFLAAYGTLEKYSEKYKDITLEEIEKVVAKVMYGKSEKEEVAIDSPWVSYAQWQFEKQWMACKEAEVIRKHMATETIFKGLFGERLNEIEDEYGDTCSG